MWCIYIYKTEKYRENIEVFLAMASNFFFFFLTLLSNYLTFLEAALVPAMYVFGDSLLDVGNNNYLNFSAPKANFYPNGIDFPTRNPTGRFCNGKNPSDFLGMFYFCCSVIATMHIFFYFFLFFCILIFN